MQRWAWIVGITLLLLESGVHGYDTHVRDTPGLKKQLYTELQGTNGCYKLLHSTGAVGCEDVSQQGVDAPIQGIRDATEVIQGARVVLLPVALMDDFLQRLLSDKDLQESVKGVVVDSTSGPVQHSSQGLQFPLQQYAPYSAPSYKWNPAGSGLNRRYIPLPVFTLSPDIVQDAWRRADYNKNAGFKGTLHSASLALTMTAKGTSVQCITQGTCLPIGGHSVWAALPSLPVDPSTGQSTAPSKPVVLVTAQIDGAALFHDRIQGAESPMSGLIALLAAAHCLQRVARQSSQWPKQLVFMGLAGEAWDLMGSRHLLWALDQGTPHVQGLKLEQVEQIVEVGQVGRAARSTNGSLIFYAHTQRTPGFGNPSPMLTVLRQMALNSRELPVALKRASASNPGIPPSSLMGFFMVNRSLPGLVITDFDTQFRNSFYESHLDDNSTVSEESVASAAVLLARALYSRVSDSVDELQVDTASVLNLVKDLYSCWLASSPGLNCDLVTQLMAPDYYMTDGKPDFTARHYIGVLQPKDPDNLDFDPDNETEPYSKRNIARFLWNFLANATATAVSQTACDFKDKSCPHGQVCVGWKYADNPGVCMTATARYVPARSTRVEMCPSCTMWNVTSAADAWNQAHGWPEDPLWAESFWPDGQPLISMYHPERRQVEVATLVAGIILTLASLVIALGTRNAFHERLKAH